MHIWKLICISMILCFCSACGTYVPAQHEFYQSRAEGAAATSKLIINVVCEARNAVYEIIRQDKQKVFDGEISERQIKWLDNWGLQLTLNLTVNEKGGITPSVLAFPPNAALATFNLAANGAFSAEANRIDKIHAYYSVQELARKPCIPENRPGGLFLMQSDLKLTEWLIDATIAQGINFVQFPDANAAPFNQDVISHEVQFIVTTNGDITPTWKLTELTVNPGSPFLSAGRVRTHNLLITLGPMDKDALAKGKFAPSRAAENSNLASDIGIAVRNSVGVNRPFF